MSFVGSAIGWLDDRTGLAGFARSSLRKVFPDHWSFLLGEIALFCFILLLATGTYLTLFFVPSGEQLQYDGPYTPLLGTEISAAYDSVLNISFEVRAGLLMRQFHHWAALVFVGAVVVHLGRIFFTAAFRKPRELNWVIGIGLLLFAIGEGFTGYSLPDDLLSGTGLRIAASVLTSIPIAGPWLAFLAFGGEYPTEQIISRLFIIHVLLLPGLLIAGLVAHIGLVWIQKHTMYRAPGARESVVKGPSFWPVQTFRSLGLLLLTGAVLAALAGLFQINPVWVYGPYQAYEASVPAQPDWYMGWLEGTLRLAPAFEPTIFGVTIPSVFVPSVVLPGIMLVVFLAWPFVEKRIKNDDAEHHLLQWPSEAPGRTAVGAAMFTLLVVLTLAGGNDVLASLMVVRLEDLNNIFRILIVVLPILVGFATYRLMRTRGARGGRSDTGAVELVRNEQGGFEERGEG